LSLRPLALGELADLVQAKLELAFAEILPENAVSIAVVRKLGFRLDGTRADEDGDAVMVFTSS